MTPQEKIAEIRQYGKKAKGRAEMIAFFQGKRLVASQAIKAFCYDCMGYYADEIEDCQCLTCPLHSFMPYAPKKVSTRTHRPLSAPKGARADSLYGVPGDCSPIIPKSGVVPLPHARSSIIRERPGKSIIRRGGFSDSPESL